MKEEFTRMIPIIFFILIFLSPILGNKLTIIVIISYIAFNFINKGNFKFNVNKFNKNNMSNTIDVNNIETMKKAKMMIPMVIGTIFLTWLFFASIIIIDAGQTGVYTLFGKVKDKELSSGFHLVIPLAKVERISIRKEEYTMSIAQGEGKKFGADAIDSLTKEGLEVKLDMTAYYRVIEEKASDLYKDVGPDYAEVIIRPMVRTAIRDIVAQYEAKDVYSEKRDEIAKKIKETVEKNVKNLGIQIEEVLLRNVVLPANLANSIQEKLQAEQESQKYDFLLSKEKKEKERKIIEAEGQRDAQKIINESLSSNYLYYLYINELKEREGTVYVPTSPSTGMPLFRELGK